MRTSKFKAQPTNALFATINQMFGSSFQLPTMLSELCAQRFDLIIARSAEVGNWEELHNIWLTVAKNAFVGWALNFRVRMLLKGAATKNCNFDIANLYYLALINRAGGLYGRIVTEVVNTDRTQRSRYTWPRSGFSHKNRLSSVNKMFIKWQTRTI